MTIAHIAQESLRQDPGLTLYERASNSGEFNRSAGKWLFGFTLSLWYSSPVAFSRLQ